MPHCPSCDYPLPPDRERLGARCPNCRDPLYEPPGRVGRPAHEGEGACALHAGQEAVGTCGRCGNYYCEVCRTRWRDRVLCASCVDRAVASREAAPEQARTQFRQAMFGVLLGAGAWVALIGAILLTLAVKEAPIVALLVLLLGGIALMLGILGLGQAASVLRARGAHLILGTIGLILSGLFVGVFIGMFSIRLWSI